MQNDEERLFLSDRIIVKKIVRFFHDPILHKNTAKIHGARFNRIVLILFNLVVKITSVYESSIYFKFALWHCYITWNSNCCSFFVLRETVFGFVKYNFADEPEKEVTFLSANETVHRHAFRDSLPTHIKTVHVFFLSLNWSYTFHFYSQVYNAPTPG